MICLVAIFGFAGNTEEVEIEQDNSLKHVASRLHARHCLGKHAYIARALCASSSIRELGLQSGARITAKVTIDWHWKLYEFPGPFAYPCACGERRCKDYALGGPRLCLNFNAREPVAQPGKKSIGAHVHEISKRDKHCWINFWHMDPAEEPAPEYGHDLSKKREDYLCELKDNVADSIVWQCFECNKVAWVATAKCRPGSSLGRPWTLSRNRSKRTRCYECHDNMEKVPF